MDFSPNFALGGKYLTSTSNFEREIDDTLPGLAFTMYTERVLLRITPAQHGQVLVRRVHIFL